ncbi:unnamed protein product [Clonostachys rosea]|uniref:EthD domain-containing protein n=1 Tax=Bionectria ochroleuca TaxID=29856 RepID=A0ABY6V1E6_BIOOC|nr:unnamed protein product [Clonostachys rosea]
MVGINLTILYPNNDDIKFNFEYFVGTHVPKLTAALKDQGLVGWEVVKYSHGADGGVPAYQAGLILKWDDKEKLQAARDGPVKAELVADLANFSNQKPTVLAGGIVSSS